MISTFSSPALRSAVATNSAARATSGLFSGRVLMLGMRRKAKSSSRKGASWLLMYSEMGWLMLQAARIEKTATSARKLGRRFTLRSLRT